MRALTHTRIDRLKAERFSSPPAAGMTKASLLSRSRGRAARNTQVISSPPAVGATMNHRVRSPGRHAGSVLNHNGQKPVGYIISVDLALGQVFQAGWGEHQAPAQSLHTIMVCRDPAAINSRPSRRWPGAVNPKTGLATAAGISGIFRESGSKASMLRPPPLFRTTTAALKAGFAPLFRAILVTDKFC
jgi:hypothetical protein